MIADIAAGYISMKYGFMGPNYCTVSACASSNHAMIDAFNHIRMGKADIMVTGGSEAAVNQPGVGGFNAMQALSTRNDDPQTASRPFDKDRDGFVIGEGAGALILEEYEHAKARGAKIYADDRAQCIRVGEMEIPIKKGVIAEENITGEIGDLLSGNVPGRENDQDITIFDATGLYILDLVAAKVAITKAKDAGMGLDVDM